MALGLAWEAWPLHWAQRATQQLSHFCHVSPIMAPARALGLVERLDNPVGFLRAPVAQLDRASDFGFSDRAGCLSLPVQ